MAHHRAPNTRGFYERINVARLKFACDLPPTPPNPGEVEIRELLPGTGNCGPDLSEHFAFTIEGGSVLRIEENEAALAHQTWYAIRNNTWANVDSFEIQYLLQIGDADANMFVTPADLSVINAEAAIPGMKPDDARCDIDGNRFCTPADLSICNAHSSGYVGKPTGHDDDPCE